MTTRLCDRIRTHQDRIDAARMHWPETNLLDPDRCISCGQPVANRFHKEKR